MNKYYTDDELNTLKKRLKLGRILTYSLLGLLITFITLMMVFISRENKGPMLIVFISLSIVLAFVMIFFALYLSYYKGMISFFNSINSANDEEVVSEVFYIEPKLFSLDYSKKVHQIQIRKDNELFIAYLSSEYEHDLEVGKQYKFVLKGNFIKGYEKYED